MAAIRRKRQAIADSKIALNARIGGLKALNMIAWAVASPRAQAQVTVSTQIL